jgi:hypothetical protein
MDKLEQEAILALQDWTNDGYRAYLDFLHTDMERFLKKHGTNHLLYDDIRDGILYIETMLTKNTKISIVQDIKKIHQLLKKAGITPTDIWIVNENVVPMSTQKDTIRGKVRGGIQKVAQVFQFKK